MTMTMPRHVVPAYTKQQADFSKRAVQRFMRLRCKVEHCLACDAYHVLFADDYALMDELHLSVLTKLAMGLRDKEIADDLQLSRKRVTHAVDRLMSRLNAISRPNLVAISVALGIINPTSYIAETKEGHAASDGNSRKNV